jgi:acyl-CoA synthetase (AMP-forming)/AMP-acid ligase II
VDLVNEHVRVRPDARALVVNADHIELSYGALDVLVEDLAAQLARTGLRRGDAVGLVCANTAEFVVALLGAARTGLVIAPLDPALPRSQMAARLQGLGARAILVGPQGVDTALVSQTGIPKYEVRVIIPAAETATVTLGAASRAMRCIRGASAELTDQDGLVLFTSGTTDRAKMVPLTHANMAASVRGICATYDRRVLGPQLSPFEIPDRLEIVASLPHTAKGAVDRRAVQDRHAH